MMKNNARIFLQRYSIAFLLAFGIALSAQAQQGLTLKSNTGTLTEFSFNNVGKLSFQNEVMTLVSPEGVSGQSFALNTLSLVTFGPVTISRIQKVQSGSNALQLYPTMSSSEIHLQGATEGSMVAVYSITGSKVMQFPVTSDQQTISVSNLKNGLYLMHVSGKTLKFCKN